MASPPPLRARIPGVPARARFWLRISVAAVSLLALVVSGYAWATYQNFTGSVPHGAAVPALGATAKDVDGGDTNLLLIGDDSRAGASAAERKALRVGHDDGELNTDTMMVLHVPTHGAATVVSFPRDSWVAIPDNGMGKLNSAYGDGYVAAKRAGKDKTAAQSAGIILTIRTIERLTGLHIDHYAQVDLLGFYRISNAIGGVTVCLNAAQNASTDKDAYGSGYSGIDLPKGISVIKGKQALAFVRQRHGLPNGDLDRIKRQQYFLASAFHKVASAGVLLNPFKLRHLLDAVGNSLLTDPKLNLVSLARQFEALSSGSVRFHTIPNRGPQLIYPDGVATSIVRVDTAALPGFIRTLQGEPADPKLAGATPARRASVTVDVLNGTQVVGLAGRNSAQLKALGFRTNLIASSDNPVNDTTIEYPVGGQSAAKAVAAVLPGARMVQTSSVKRATVLLGADGKQVRGLGGTNAARASGPSTTASNPSTTAPATESPVMKVTGGLGCIN
jgi:LCP family protein required for cell wall assembly